MTAKDRSRGPDKLRRAVSQQLEGLQRAGVTHTVKPRRKAGVSASVAASTATAAAAKTAAAPVPTPVPPRSSADQIAAKEPVTGDRAAALKIIQQEVAGCVRCDELASTRTQTVFGVGNPHARLCFLGEAPGADEDKQGEPFVGRAGQLLTKIIEACTLTRQDVYILNVLKCRPPGNRNPLPHEVHNCREYLDRQLQIIQPEFICCLGTIAAQTLLETDEKISRMRGRFLEYLGIPVMCTYHPAYLLRNPGAKKDVWEDMKTLMTRMGIDVTAGKQ